MSLNAKFKQSPVALCVAALMSSASAGVMAETQTGADVLDEDYNLEEIVVVGVKGAQATAVNTKRNSAAIVDAISAEDIGKLPDVTISDSLQRVPGIQIRRTAGEGGAINIRGLPQVLTTLNGESFMSAGSVTNVQPDFNDIPSQLFGGALVQKSPVAENVAGGITGTVDLRTRRPMSFDEGWTYSGAFELQYGEDTQETDTSINGLINWRDETKGFSLSVAKSDVNLANFYNGFAGGDDAGWTGFPAESWAWGEPTDINGDGDIGDAFITYQGHTAYNKATERDRLGVNFAFQAELSESLDMVAEVFHTDMQNFDRFAGIANSDKWQRWGWYTPAVFRDTGVNLGDGNRANTVQVYQGDGRRLKTYAENQVTDKTSTNVNLELNYDNGGAFTGSFRLVYGEAEQNRINGYADIDLANGSQWGVEFQNYPEGLLATNPNGYTGNPQITVDYRGENPHWSGFSPIVSDLSAYSIGALSSENNFDREGELAIGSLQGSYEFSEENFFTSVDGGIRVSSREAFNSQYHLLSPFGEQGCLVRWRATDVVLGADSCSFGDGNGTFFTAGQPTPLSAFGDAVIEINDFGGVTGIPTVFSLNPRAMDNVFEFFEGLYPGNVRGVIPGQSYKVELDEVNYHVQGNFQAELGSVPVSGNIGVRVIDTDLTVQQNLVGAAQPYGAPELDIGDEITKRSFTDVLPSINAAFELKENLVLRAAYAETMAPLDLAQWGGGLSPTFAINSDTGIFEIISASSSGNPELDPWRAENYDLSLEWYTGEASMISLGLFKIDVESFVEGGDVAMDLPDQDGVVRRTTNVSTNVQGDGGTLEGAELQIKQAFDFLPGLWGNFGVDLNYTYAPSDSGNDDLQGRELPFINNSEELYNLVGWYQDDRLQARIALNHRSERVVFFDRVWGTEGLTLFQAPTTYVDASISYDISENLTVYLNGSNLTGEREEYFLQWEDQVAYRNLFEPRYTLGVRGRF